MSTPFPPNPTFGGGVPPAQPFGNPAAFGAQPVHGQPGPDAPKRGKKASKKGVKLNRRSGIILAVVGGAILVLAGNNAGSPSTYVVVLKNPAAALSSVTQAQLEAIPVSNEQTVEGAFTGSSAEEALKAALAGTEGRVTRYPLSKRQQLSASLFDTDLTTAVPLSAGERFVSVRAAAASSVGGTLRAGDRVDILVAAKTSDGKAGIVVQNVEIIKTTSAENALDSAAAEQTGEKGRDKSPDELLPGDPIPGTYVVRVPNAAVIPLVSADANGRLYLVLRSSKDAQELSGPAVSVDDVLNTAS